MVVETKFGDYSMDVLKLFYGRKFLEFGDNEWNSDFQHLPCL